VTWLKNTLGKAQYRLLDPTYNIRSVNSPGIRKLLEAFEEHKHHFGKESRDIHLDLPAPLEHLTLPGIVDQGLITLPRYDHSAQPCSYLWLPGESWSCSSMKLSRKSLSLSGNRWIISKHQAVLSRCVFIHSAPGTTQVTHNRLSSLLAGLELPNIYKNRSLIPRIPKVGVSRFTRSMRRPER
jgi:hypothetical protein